MGQERVVLACGVEVGKREDEAEAGAEACAEKRWYGAFV